MSDLRFDTRVKPSPTARRAMIGKYEIIGKLGAGGMGTVHLGRAPDGQIVAVKVIHPRLAVDEQFLRRFRREANLARRVAPFCTAPVLDFGEDAQGPYLVTEYVDGVPLSRAVAERGALPSSSVQGVAVGVAAALTAIHAAGLVHRDLKPGNVILSLCGPRVIDFGVARAIDGSSDLTRTGMMVGSPGWMAPEQATGGPLTQAVDIFGWGCLVAFAATGRHPFGGGDSANRVLQILQQEPDLTGLPENLYPHIVRAISKRPENRPTARALLSLLSSGEEDVTELVRLPGLDKRAERAGKRAERTGKQAERAGKQAEHMGKSIEQPGKQAVRPEQWTSPAPRQQRSRRWPLVAALLAGVSAATLAAGVAYPALFGDAQTPPGTVPSSVAPSESARPSEQYFRPVPAKSTTPSATPSVSSTQQAEPTPQPSQPSPSAPMEATPTSSPAPSSTPAPSPSSIAIMTPGG